MKRLGIFLGITFFLTWTIEFILMANGGLTNPYAVAALVVVMLMPALSVVLTRLITREGFKDFGIRPHFKGHVKIYLMAWFGPALLILLGALVYFLFFPGQFDPSMSQIAGIYQSQGINLSGDTLKLVFLTQLAVGFLLSPVINLFATAGEEIGWRGYLLPKLMEHYRTRTAIVISGVIWGLWHAPIIAMGHNYGLGYPTAPWGGIIAMVFFCLFVGSFFSYLAIRSGSFWPPALAHGALNGFAGISAWFTLGPASPFIGPLPVGIIGGIGFIAVGILCFMVVGKEKPTAIEEAAIASV